VIRPVRWLPLSLLVHASLLGGGVWLVQGVGERALLVDLTLTESPERASSPPGGRPAAPARRRQASAPAARAAAPAASAPAAPPAPVAPSPAPAAVPPVADAPPAVSPAPVVTAPAAPGPADSVVASETPIASEPHGGGAAGGEGATGGAAAVPAASQARGGADGGGTLALAIPGEGGAGVYGPYLAALRRRLQEALEYPAAARRRGLSGTVHLEIALEATGRVSDVLLVRSSSHAVLDAAALDAARNLRRVPFPADVRPRALRVRLPVVFELR
jgi:periplasmic protein TonB